MHESGSALVLSPQRECVEAGVQDGSDERGTVLAAAFLLAQQDGPTEPSGGAGAFIPFIVFLGVVLVFIGLPVWCIVDAIRRRPEEWRQAGQSKSLWIFLQFFAWGIASIIYFAVIWPRLRRAATELAHS